VRTRLIAAAVAFISSVYKISPDGMKIGDSKVGVCSNDSTIDCNFDTDCGGNACNAVIAGSYPIYHVSGSCSGGSNPGDHCMKDADCDGGTCDGMSSNVSTLTFDGTHMWVTNSAYGDHNSSGSECQDGLDNDGNGMCDFDGATGNPGCSGRPDPGCDAADDTMERSEYLHLTRLVAATGQIVESIPVSGSDQVSGAVFDGSSIWLGGRNFDRNTLAQYYSGSGLGLTDLAGSVALQSAIRSDKTQPGSFSISGSADFGAKLTVVGDLVVQNNVWGGSSDTMGYFGQSCPEGQFAKGIQLDSIQEFGSGGVITITDGQGDGFNNVHITSEYIYIGGSDDTFVSRLEKRRIDNAELCVNNTVCEAEFGSGGAIVNSDNQLVYDIAFDDDYMYIAGYDDATNDPRIEKRRQSDGSYCTDASPCDGTGFGYNNLGVYTGDGVVLSDGDHQKSIAIDSTYIYVVSHQWDGSQDDWRIEKRLQTTGELVVGFGTGGIQMGEVGSRYPDIIAIDDTYMYVAGNSDSWNGRVEKRLLSTGALEPSFGTGGVIDGMITDPFDMVIDSDYLYIIGLNWTSEWSFEKYRLSDGVACNNANPCDGDVFGTDGLVTGVTGFGLGLAVDGDYIYAVGKIDPPGADFADWRIERRLLGTGELDTYFGTNGYIVSDSSSGAASDIVIDGTYMYVTGSDDSFNWRLEKRSLFDAGLGNLPGALECRPL